MAAAIVFFVTGAGIAVGVLYQPSSPAKKDPGVTPPVAWASKVAEVKNEAPTEQGSPQKATTSVLASVPDVPKPKAGASGEKTARVVDEVSLTIDSEPAGAKAYDRAGGFLGETQLTVPRPRDSGMYEVVLKLPGYRDAVVRMGTASDSKQVRQLTSLSGPPRASKTKRSPVFPVKAKRKVKRGKKPAGDENGTF